MLSFLISYLYVAVKLRNNGVENKHIAYSMFLNTILILYCSITFTMIEQLIKYKEANQLGFSSLGGMIGLIIGTSIYTKMNKHNKDILYETYILSLGLMYSISKIGCLLAGCCYGIRYTGLLNITYIDTKKNMQNLFPVQLFESVTFLIVFIILNLLRNKLQSKTVRVTLISYAILKFSLDYLRYYSNRNIVSTNQLVCIVVVIINILLETFNFKNRGQKYESRSI
jgi:prolipoprotein diacylglyceryltransferase